MTVAAKITSKGQVTLPRYARGALATDTVEVTVDGEKVILIPVKSVAGVLKKYATSPEKPLAEIRELIWQEVADAEKE